MMTEIDDLEQTIGRTGEPADLVGSRPDTAVRNRGQRRGILTATAAGRRKSAIAASVARSVPTIRHFSWEQPE
jgi:hypothetical protein